jgi:hypothetical protein
MAKPIAAGLTVPGHDAKVRVPGRTGKLLLNLRLTARGPERELTESQC